MSLAMKTCKLRGNVSEYNLANLSVGQEVTFTSKVYQDKSWTGKISYISDYPKTSGEAASAATAAALVILVLNIHIPSMLQVKSVI